jgi:hypothetical protein
MTEHDLPILKFIVFIHMAATVIGAGFPRFFCGYSDDLEGRFVGAAMALCGAMMLCLFGAGMAVLLS